MLAQNARSSRWKWVPLLIALAVVINFLIVSKDYFLGYVNYLTGRMTRTEFVLKDVGPDGIEAEQIADYIRRNTTPDERILTWTEQASICYMANRRSSSDILWPVYISVLGPPERVLADKPRFIVVDRKESELPPVILSELQRTYRLEMTTEKNRVYGWVANQ